MTENSGQAAVSDKAGAGWLCLSVSADDEEIAEQALVLRSQGLPHGVRNNPGQHELWIPAVELDRARAILRLQAQDEADDAGEPAAAPDRGASVAGVVVAALLVAFFWVTGERDAGDRGGWFRVGTSVADLVTAGGQWWRAGTALTLHADPAHVGGNAVAALIFVGALGRWMGGGTAALVTLVVGFLGNLGVAYGYGTAHSSVGASTATFGALGVLVGLQIRRWFSPKRSLSAYFRRRRALAIVGAALGFFAMVGVGPTSDVAAHACGLAVGVAAGLALYRWVSQTPRGALSSMGQGICALMALVVLAGLWTLAFAAT